MSPSLLGRGDAALASRLLSTGSANLLSSAILVAIPLLGSLYLTDRTYATWALAATILTVAIVLDFGGPAYVSREFAAGTRSWRVLRDGTVLTGTGSLLVAGVAAMAWPLYADPETLAFGDYRGSLLLLASGAGAALRGAVAVLGAALLSLNRLRARTCLLLGQAIAQALLTLGLLGAGAGLWSLAAGALLSALPPLLAARWLLRHDLLKNASSGGIVKISASSFARSRGAVTLLGLSMTQLDRWAVGAVASPSFLTQYDVLIRLASLPRVFVIGLTTVLVADGSRLTSPSQARTLIRRTTALVGVFTLLASLAVILGGGYFVANSFAREDQRALLLLLIAAVVWFGANALTAPMTLVLTGLGRPGEELKYLLPAGVLTAIAWAGGLISGSAMQMVLCAGGALGISSIAFIVYGDRRLAKAGLT